MIHDFSLAFEMALQLNANWPNKHCRKDCQLSLLQEKLLAPHHHDGEIIV